MNSMNFMLKYLLYNSDLLAKYLRLVHWKSWLPRWISSYFVSNIYECYVQFCLWILWLGIWHFTMNLVYSMKLNHMTRTH